VFQGYNTDLKINGNNYHIQTELVGNRIVTLIFENGAVVGGRKTEILTSKFDTDGTISSEMKNKMKKQHSEIISEVKHQKEEPSVEDVKKEADDKDLIKKFLDNWVNK
jgi:hypothetical protein